MDKLKSYIIILLFVTILVVLYYVKTISDKAKERKIQGITEQRKIDALQFRKSFGGDNHEWAMSVQQTNDDGYIMLGYTESFGEGNSDMFLIKTNPRGVSGWSRTFGGSDRDYGNYVEQTKDGGYILIGYTDSFGNGNTDMYLIKTDPEGNEIWSKTFGGEKEDMAHFVRQTNDGGYIITGYTESYGSGNKDVYLLKTDSKGEIMWQKTFGTMNYEWGYSVRQTLDGGYIIVGTDTPDGDSRRDVYLIKTDSEGNQEWDKRFGEDKDNDWGNFVRQTSDGGYIISGCTKSYGYGAGKTDMYLIKTDAEGNEMWHKTFGGKKEDYGYTVEQTKDGGYILVGGSESFNKIGDMDIYLIKMDPYGNTVPVPLF